jgi:DNA-binding transcriptional LysR family regulator
MELRHFRYFVAVAEELHFTRAAERLHIGQPPLSLQIQAIEREVGTLLLNRSRRKVELTAAGELFLEEARRALAQAERAIDSVKRAARGEVGTLRLSFITSVPLIDIFTRAVRGFRASLPDVHLELKIKPTVSILDDILLSASDVGFVRPSIETVLPRNLGAVPVFQDQLRLVLPVDHPLASRHEPVGMSSLRNERFVLRSPGSGTGFYEQVFTLCSRAGFVPKVIQEATEATTTLGLVAAGVGITVMPETLQSIRVHDVVWRRIADSGTSSRILLVFDEAIKNALRDRFVSRFSPVDQTR